MGGVCVGVDVGCWGWLPLHSLPCARIGTTVRLALLLLAIDPHCSNASGIHPGSPCLCACELGFSAGAHCKSFCRYGKHKYRCHCHTALKMARGAYGHSATLYIVASHRCGWCKTVLGCMPAPPGPDWESVI